MNEKLPFDESHEPWNNGEGGPLICGRCGAESGSLKGSKRCSVELAEAMARVEARGIPEPTILGPKPTVWQPIETAPKNGTQVLGYVDGWISAMEWSGLGWDFQDGDISRDPTHWMPLPEPPK